ncbi:MAG TPA: M14 family zinc carboxypeptidase [Bryobacteraceae bacterium]|nr:M14 family zinc carboxypeptidase [Bryobacteraceae bacterium]
MNRVISFFLLGVLSSAPLCAQKSFEFWPGTTYDPKVPTLRQVLGYDPGDRVTSHAGIVRYMEALAAAAPNRIKVFDYGETWEGRKLIYAAVASEANLRRLAAIKSDIEKLSDPRKTPEAEARRIMAGLPAVVWLSYGVHGNEISSPDAALLAAYHLLAAHNDKLADDILAKVVVLIDPTQNPDGRDRFVHYFDAARGLEPDSSPAAVEHQEPWPGGRTNHYLFDLNRDWIALTQPEIRNQVKVLREWYPLVYVDLHEMGADSTYFFSPEADPFNPHLTSGQRESLKLFGHNNAKWFDQYGFDYFTRENYDAFYPGYGASWPFYYGGIAMTYEQASVRGLVVRRSDETLLTFRDTVRHHFVASISTLETAAANREKLLNDFYRYRVTAIDEGSSEPVKEYILPRGRDAAATDKLAGILVEHGVEVKRATAPFHAEGREYAVGTYVVPMAQPSKRLIRTLLDPQVSMDDKFIAAEEARRKLKQRSEIYDVTAWSLPLLFNVELVAASAVSQGSFEAAKAARVVPGEMHGAPATVAYLVPWGSAAAGRLLTAALRQDLKVHSSDKPLEQVGVKFPSGTLVFKTAGNPADLADRLARLARETGANVFGTNSGWVDEGVNFGSRYVVPVRRPAIAMAWDTPTSSSSAGAARFVLERQYGYPVTPVRAAALNSAELARFQVLILPEGTGYAQSLGASGIQRLKEWVQSGGTIVALGSAVSFLADARLGLLEITQENALKESEEKKPPTSSSSAAGAGGGATAGGGGRGAAVAPGERVPGTSIATEADFEKVTRANTEPPDSAPGAILRARIRPDFWLTAGLGESVNVMVEGRAIYSPLKADQGINAAFFEAADKLVASGYLWSENRKQMPFKPLVVTNNFGRGMVIGFTVDPNFRAIQDGMNVLFLNAIFRGPAHTRASGFEER